MIKQGIIGMCWSPAGGGWRPSRASSAPRARCVWCAAATESSCRPPADSISSAPTSTLTRATAYSHITSPLTCLWVQYSWNSQLVGKKAMTQNEIRMKKSLPFLWLGNNELPHSDHLWPQYTTTQYFILTG